MTPVNAPSAGHVTLDIRRDLAVRLVTRTCSLCPHIHYIEISRLGGGCSAQGEGDFEMVVLGSHMTGCLRCDWPIRTTSSSVLCIRCRLQLVPGRGETSDVLFHKNPAALYGSATFTRPLILSPSALLFSSKDLCISCNWYRHRTRPLFTSV